MAFVKHSVNIFLVLLIVVSVSTIAGLTLYYQGTFQNVVGESFETRTELATCQATLGAANQELQIARMTVSANQEDVEKTVSLFEEKQSELADAQLEIANAEAEIARLKTTIVNRDKEIQDKNTVIAQRESVIVERDRRIETLEARIERLLEDSC